MTRHRDKVRGLLRQTRILAMGIATGSTLATPVLAATISIGDIPIGDITKPMLLGSLALLVIGLVLKAKYGKSGNSVPPVAGRDFNEGIGRYRLQLGRGDAY